MPLLLMASVTAAVAVAAVMTADSVVARADDMVGGGDK